MSLKGRILAIDYGEKRTGIAVSDPLQVMGYPLTTVATDELMDFLKEYISTEDVRHIIIGHPELDDPQKSPLASQLEELRQEIGKVFPELSVEFVDETLSSREAVQTLVQAGIKKRKRRKKETVDTMSAAVILQRYLGNI